MPKEDALGRRVWDRAEFTVGEEEEQSKIVEVPTETLKQREKRLNLELQIGKQKVVSAGAAEDEQGGFYCKSCECLLKDSSSYLDHINGKKHNRILGMTMRVKKATKSDVVERLKRLKEKQKLCSGRG